MPIAAPTIVPTAIIQKEIICRSSRVAANARVIPIAASRLPDRAVAGELSCFNPSMKRMAATMYAMAMPDSRTSSILLFLHVSLAEHLQHPVRHDKTAEDVRRSENHSDKTKHLQQRRVCRARDEHRAEHDDSVNRVGPRHEWSVKN